MNGFDKVFKFVVIFLLSVFIFGCTFTNKPRPRPGSYATGGKAKFIDCNSLGTHSYGSFVGEKDGIAYTCRGGHIDIAHLRIAADNVYYRYNKILKKLEAGETEVAFSLNTDTSDFVLHITYPTNLNKFSTARRKEVFERSALDMAQYCSWQMVSWHEVLTWFGMKALLVLPQFESAFSWEDNYSNLLGTVIAVKAIERPGTNFDNDMTISLTEELQKLDPQPACVGYYASEKMRDTWYTSGMGGTHMILRHMDLGVDDGYVSPMIVPDICPTVAPKPYPIPKLAVAKQFGFKAELEIDNHGMAGSRCLKMIYPNGEDGPIYPEKHLAILMKCIKEDAIERGYTVFP